MADNTRLPLGPEDGDIYASDDVSGVKFQRVKMTLGADGVNDGDVSATNPIPIKLSNTGIGDGRKTITTSGTAETLATSTACKHVFITAETDNTGVIVIGGSTVVAALGTRRGTHLNAGDSIDFAISNLSLVYLDTTVNGDGVTYTYLT